MCLRINWEEFIKLMQRKWEGISIDMHKVLISPMPHKMNVVICSFVPKVGVLDGKYVPIYSQILVSF